MLAKSLVNVACVKKGVPKVVREVAAAAVPVPYEPYRRRRGCGIMFDGAEAKGETMAEEIQISGAF